MRYHFFLHYGWFFQNLEKVFIPILLHTTVVTIFWVLGPIHVIPYAICKLDTFPASIMQHIQYLLSFELD